jgi:hypothetical protein
VTDQVYEVERGNMSDFSNKRKCNLKVLIKELKIMREVNRKKKKKQKSVKLMEFCNQACEQNLKYGCSYETVCRICRCV